MEEKKKNILIVGQGAVAHALARKLKTYNSIGKIYIARGCHIESEEYISVDIAEDNHTELLKFVLENDISTTIPVSNKALKSDIVSFFQANGQNIFGPTKKSCTPMLNKITGKKLLYKAHAQTAKFGIFDKLQNAIDYLKTSSFPVIIQNNNENMVCPTLAIANRFLSDLIYYKKETDVLIEDYTYGHDFTIYFITDGYSAIPFSTVADFRFSQEEHSGDYTNGVGCYVPDFKVSQEIIQSVSDVIHKIISSLANKDMPYVGIIGAQCVLTSEDKFIINGLKPFLQEHDVSAILNLIEADLIKLFDSCIHGYFSDEYNEIKTNDSISAAIIISSKYDGTKVNIEDTDNIDFINIKKSGDEYITNRGKIFTITKSAKTLSRAKKYLEEEIVDIKFNGIQYNKDVIS